MPSTGLVPNVGEKKMLETFAGLSTPQNLVLHLFKNDITPASTMALSDYTEATFTGYSPVTLSSGDWVITSGFPTAATYSSGVVFTCGGSTSESVYGFYLSEAVTSELMWSERFEAAKPITYVGDSLTILPRLQLFGGVTLPGLKAYFTLDESTGTRYDSVGEAHLTPINGPTSVAGVIGNAASFDKASTQSLKALQPILIDGSLGISVVCWIKIRTGVTVNQVYFLDGSGTISAHSMSLGDFNSTTKTIGFAVQNDAFQATAQIVVPNLDTWYFIAATYDPSTRKCFVSRDAGVQTNLGSALGGALHPNITIGNTAIGGFTTLHSNTDMDAVRVYNTVLSTGQIEYLYARTVK